MERLVLIGVSHRRGGALALEAWQAFDDERIKAQGFSHFVRIATCNRWDTVLSLPKQMNVDEARHKLSPNGQTIKPYVYVGDAALEQLTRIASSLDSLNPGEDQIMKQVREAHKQAQQQAQLNKRLSFAFEIALRIAKKVRREIDLAPMNSSLFSLARQDIEAFLKPNEAIAVIGSGAMGSLAAQSLSFLGYDVTIVNRTEQRAKQLALKFNCKYQSLETFLAQSHKLRAMVTATPIKDLFNEAELKKLAKLELVVDLGMPRNMNALACQQQGVRVLDVDTLQVAGELRREELSVKLAEADKLIQAELALAFDDWAEKEIGPEIKQLRDWYLATLGDSLAPDDAKTLAHKFAHVPVKGLRAIARAYGVEAAKLFLKECGLSERV